jgi:hypothetical protein
MILRIERATEESLAKKEIPQKWTGDEVEVSIRTDVPEESTGELKEVNDGRNRRFVHLSRRTARTTGARCSTLGR